MLKYFIGQFGNLQLERTEFEIEELKVNKLVFFYKLINIEASHKSNG